MESDLYFTPALHQGLARAADKKDQPKDVNTINYMIINLINEPVIENSEKKVKFSWKNAP